MRYVFIVGLPRTGTKLVQDILETATRPSCKLVPETWFFGDMFRSGLRKVIRKIGRMRNDDNVRKLTRYMFSGAFSRSYYKRLSDGHLRVDEESLRNWILATDRSDRAIYDAMLVLPAVADIGMEAATDVIVGDKMPGNLYYVPTLLQWFPDAKVIHTFRDPRAILASEWRKVEEIPENQYIVRAIRSVAVVVYITVTWLYAIRLHRKYSQKYPDNYYFSKYEELVGDPATKVPELCRFLNVEVDERMFRPRQAGSRFAKRKQGGFNSAGLDRWKKTLAPWAKMWVSVVMSKYLREFGYES
jgi:hypothetical protein